MVHPLHRDEDQQIAIVEKLDPLLRRDGFTLARSGLVSGYPIYRIQSTAPAGSQPADELISETVASFDEAGVHEAWQKALDRRSSDPEGAITAAKTLLETVCKRTSSKRVAGRNTGITTISRGSLLRRFLHRPGFLSHLRSLNGYDGPEILSISTQPICLIGADAGHCQLIFRQVLILVEGVV